MKVDLVTADGRAGGTIEVPDEVLKASLIVSRWLVSQPPAIRGSTLNGIQLAPGPMTLAQARREG